jgi:hypothetical protein
MSAKSKTSFHGNSCNHVGVLDLDGYWMWSPYLSRTPIMLLIMHSVEMHRGDGCGKSVNGMVDAK